MRELTTYGNIRSGRLHISYRDRFDEAVSTWPDCRIILTVKKIYNTRSNQQNAYLHGVIIPEVQRGLIEAGYSANEVTLDAVKDLLKYRFAKKEIVNTTTGETIELIQATHEMSTAEMTDFIEEVRRFSSEYLGVYIPSPNEQLEIR